MNKLNKNKFAKGIVSLATIIIVLTSILAGTIYYGGNITSNVVSEVNDEPQIQIKTVDNIEQLSYLNEGWYQIRNGYVFYLDTFNSYVPLYIKVRDLYQQDGLLSVDADGNIEFHSDLDKLYEKEIVEENNLVESSQNKVTGAVTGLEKVSGFETVTFNKGEYTEGKVPTTPSVPGTSSTTPKPTGQYFVNVGEKKYNMIIVTTDNLGKTTIKVYPDATKNPDGNVVTTKDPTIFEVSNSKALEGAIYQEWNGNSISSLPIKSGSKTGTRDASSCTSSTSCVYTDTFTDGTKTKTTISDLTTTVETSKIAYFSEGKEITKAESDKLKKEGKTVTSQEISTSKVITEIGTDGKVKSTTTYTYNTIFDVNKNPIVTYEAIKIDQTTGNVVEFTYGEGDKKVVITPIKDGDSLSSPFTATNMQQYSGDQELSAVDPNLQKNALNSFSAYKSRQFFSEVERVFTEFSGLGYYATLFFDDDSLLAWRDNVDRIFATLYLGTEYWSSAICSVYLDGENEGIAYAETPQGLAQVAAHIEATRTEPIQAPTGTQFIYKITFSVRNGDFEDDPRAPEEMNINVVLKGEKEAKVFTSDQKVERGSVFSKTGTNAIVQDSTTLYTEVCLTFDQIPLRWKISDNEICNEIVQSSGEATTVTTAAATTTTGTSTSGINDF